MTDKTLRDEFAMAALSGLLSDLSDHQTVLDVMRDLGKPYGVPASRMADVAYEFADAMLKARSNKG